MAGGGSRADRSFIPLPGSTGPGFNSSLGSSGVYVLESTALNRFWNGPTGRIVRLASLGSSASYYVTFGSSLIVPGSTDGTLIMGGSVETFALEAGQSYLGIKSSTDCIVNVTLGYGE